MARNRPGRLRLRRDSKPQLHQGSQAIAGPASKAGHHSEADDHRQAKLLWRGAAPGHAEHRTSIAQGPEQARLHPTPPSKLASEADRNAVPIAGLSRYPAANGSTDLHSKTSNLAVDDASVILRRDSVEVCEGLKFRRAVAIMDYSFFLATKSKLRYETIHFLPAYRSSFRLEIRMLRALG